MGSLQQVLIACKPGEKKRDSDPVPQIIQQKITDLLNVTVSMKSSLESIVTHKTHASRPTSSRFAENFF